MTTEEQTPVAAEIATDHRFRLEAVQLLASVDYQIARGVIDSKVTIDAFKALAAHFPHIEWETK